MTQGADNVQNLGSQRGVFHLKITKGTKRTVYEQKDIRRGRGMERKNESRKEINIK